MATSSRRTQANQQNALQSTGPRTKAGKAASSGNSVQHSILDSPFDLGTMEVRLVNVSKE